MSSIEKSPSHLPNVEAIENRLYCSQVEAKNEVAKAHTDVEVAAKTLDRLRKEAEEVRKSLNHLNESGTPCSDLPPPGGLINCLVAWPKPV